MSRTTEPPDGYNKLANGLLTESKAKALGMGAVGCAFRGSLICLRCPYPPKRKCDWWCSRCVERALCKCAQPGQEIRIARDLGLTEEGLEYE